MAYSPKMFWRLAAPLVVAGMVFATAFLGAGSTAQVPPVKDRGYWVEEVTTGLQYPWAFTWLPNGDMLVTERTGKLRVIRKGKLLPEPIEGLPEVATGYYDGLLDIKLDPDFKQNSLVYLSFSESSGDGDLRHGAIFKARLEGNRLVDGKVIFRSYPSAIMGPPTAVRMLFLPDKTLIMGVGSAQASMAQAASLGTDVAKIIRIDRDGNIPKDNPFLNTPGARPELWAIGVRNLSGLIRAADGQMWLVDIGPKGGDELNRVKAGDDLGWPKVTWGFEYNGTALSKKQEAAGVVDPVLMWHPAYAPSGLAQYSGRTFPQWDGDFFIGGLKGRSIMRVRVANGQWVQQERMVADLGERIRSIEVGPDNLIYFISDGARGRLFRFRPGSPKASEQKRIATKLTQPDTSRADMAALGVFLDRKNPVDGKRAFAERCSGCHRAGPFTTGDVGPDLNGVIGRVAGQHPGYSYSPALSNPDAQRPWSVLAMSYFLANPQEMFPGTSMATDPIAESDVRMAIGQFLATTSAPSAPGAP